MPDIGKTEFPVANYIILTFAIVANVSALYLLKSLREKRSIQMMYLMSLSFVDIILACCWIIRDLITGGISSGVYHIMWCVFMGFYVIWYTMMYSLTIDRFIGINFPIKYKLFLRKKYVLIVIISCWSCGISLAVITAVTDPAKAHRAFIRYVYTAVDLTFLALFIATYTSIFIRIARRQEGSNRQQQNQKFLLVTSALLVAFLLFETVPSILQTFLLHKNAKFESIRSLFYTINLLCDPVLYVLLQPRIRAIAHEKFVDVRMRSRCSKRKNAEIELKPMPGATKDVNAGYPN